MEEPADPQSTSLLGPLETTGLLVGGVLALSLLWWVSTRRPAGIPPGPGFALPILGHLHLLEKDPRAKYYQWRKQYGDVFSLYIGSRLVIVVCGYSVLREVCVKFGYVLNDRPHTFLTDKISNYGEGVVFAMGPVWKEQRKTSLDIFRKLGVGKNTLAAKIEEEVSHYIRAVESYQGKPVNLHRLTTTSVSNNISSIMFGERFDYDDPVFKERMDGIEDDINNLGGVSIANFFPFLRYIPGDFFGVKQFLSNLWKFRNHFIKPRVEQHLETFTGAQDTDFIYAYLSEKKKMEDKGMATTLSKAHLMTTVGDLFVAGTETTAGVCQWVLLYLLHWPDKQEKCYKEICNVVGAHRRPNIQDRLKLTYLEAVILESLRLGNIGPFALHHGSCSRDVVFRGYVIPKDAIVMPFLETAHYDEAIWGDAKSFQPERFIDAEGRLIKWEEFIPFGMGRRVCLGESLARMELFLYISALVQTFQFLPEDPNALPPLEGTLGVTHAPKEYKIRAVRRT